MTKMPQRKKRSEASITKVKESSQLPLHTSSNSNTSVPIHPEVPSNVCELYSSSYTPYQSHLKSTKTERPLHMCNPENTTIYEVYEECGHSLPQQACDYYANAWQQCLASHDHARGLKVYDWKDGEVCPGFCRFCEEGKDINGVWKYGAKWAGREKRAKEKQKEKLDV